MSASLKVKAIMLYEKTVRCADNVKELDELLQESEQVLTLGVGNCCVIAGDSGSGKTTLVKAFIKRFNAKQVDDANDSTPTKACYIRSPSNMNPLDLFRSILSGMGEPGIIHGSEVELRRRIVQQLKNKHYRVLVFDEFQQVVEKVGVKSARQIADYLKELVDEFGLFLIFAGTSNVLNLLKINEQFASRGSLIIEKKLLSLSTKGDYTTFVNYLLSLNTVLQFTQVDFTKPEINLPIFAITKGDLRQLSILIRKAIFKAESENRDQVLKKDFVDVSSTVRVNQRRKSNPFSKNVKALKIDLGVKYEV
ncbi:TniB family NTP-binding protein [Pseudoalteromonas sp. SR41-4]|uniref:TniB family NTP-binding protein n=1 Tax=Pseudoalteromonas sp. SR41-4 TaxID=2760950 RepID=UPI0016049171|nr:TniB family NTP-binding protein [Pseudoalteromonas sp. SR41-4]MBB1291606.1 TniB family NTP-binding protein [Pseudoalteromonas sp. SR41-4]